MTKFIGLTERSSGGPVSINVDAIQTVKPGRNDGTHIQFRDGGDQLYVVVEETYEETLTLLNKD